MKHVWMLLQGVDADRWFAGGETFTSFKEAQEQKRKYQQMSSGFRYRIIRYDLAPGQLSFRRKKKP